jgi:hypothetical protein
MKQNFVRLAQPRRCDVCGKLIQAGTLVQPVHPTYREQGIACPSCVMKHGGHVDDDDVFKTATSEFATVPKKSKSKKKKKEKEKK